MQKGIKVLTRRRTYNAFVTNESLEDYSIRYAAKSFRKWPEWLLASTALGGISFLALEAIGALLIVNYGFTNAVCAILAVSIIIFITGLPITYYASKYNVDIDLLTRGAGFGYIGSTITSLIYASFTFIFFAIEASIMAQAIKMYFGIPLPFGYVICSIIIIPLVFFGVTFINKLQIYTQPIWIILMVLPYIFIFHKDPEALSQWFNFGGRSPTGSGFDLILFGAAMTLTFSLIAQIGEQVDYLRFIPDKTSSNKYRWWLAVVLAGPGWIIIGMLKLLGGAFLASLVIGSLGIGISDAIEPTHMYLNAYKYVFENPEVILAITTLFVVVSQIKINVTNAYAGSLAWSNFFSRLTHSHAGRVVWLVFNVLIALLLMQFGLLFTLESVLGLYANLAIAWIGAIFADLVVLKPLGISPSYIEFKRAYLYNFNPVGVGAMVIASIVSVLSYFGTFGYAYKAYSAPIAFSVSFLSAIAIAYITKGHYYIAREKEKVDKADPNASVECTICSKYYEYRDMVFCTMYKQWVCSLCCCLEIRCKDYCKRKAPTKRLEDLSFEQAIASLSPWQIKRPMKRFLIYFSCITLVLAPIFAIFYYHAVLSGFPFPKSLLFVLINIFVFVLVVLGVLLWCLSLSKEHSKLVEEELDLYIFGLEQEISEHEKTESALRREKVRTDEELSSRKLISEELNHALRQQKLILDNTSIGIGFVKKGKCMWGNKRFMEMTSIKEDTNRELQNLIYSKDVGIHMQDPKSSGNNMKSGNRYCSELLIRCNDTGQNMWVLLVASALDPANIDDGVICLVDDITERKNTLEELRKSQNRLLNLNEKLEEIVGNRTKELEQTYISLRQADKMASLGILVSGIAHEINNPLGFIGPNSKILQEMLKDIVDIIQQHKDRCKVLADDCENLTIAGLDYPLAMKSIPKMLAGILAGTERITAIVTNLKSYSRPMPLQLGTFVDLNSALDASLALVRNAIKKSTDRFGVEKGGHLPVIKGDIRGIEQVVINLIQNACQALTSRDQGIYLSTYAEDGLVALKVRDEGIGISEEDLQHIRDPFFTTKRDLGGTGLGLSVSARIVKEHNGTMKIDSVIGKGTVATLYFPASNRV